jgi:hypothetical protein
MKSAPPTRRQGVGVGVGVCLVVLGLLVVVDLFIIHFLEVLVLHLSLLMNKGPL